MAKTRVYELAKTLGITPHDLVEKLRAMGVEVKGNLTPLEDEVVLKMGGTVAGPAGEKPAKPKASVPRAAKKVAEQAPKAGAPKKGPAPKPAAAKAPKPAAPKAPHARSAKASPAKAVPEPPPKPEPPIIMTTTTVQLIRKGVVVPPSAKVVPPPPAPPPVAEVAPAPPAPPEVPVAPPAELPEAPAPVRHEEPVAPAAAEIPEAPAAVSAPPEPPKPVAPPPPPAPEIPPHRIAVSLSQIPLPPKPAPGSAPVAPPPVARPPVAPPARHGAPSHARPGQGHPSGRPTSPPPAPRTVTHPHPPKPGAQPSAPSAGRPGPSARPGGGRPESPRPPARTQPHQDTRRKTKRERRMEKVQAREDRKTKLQDELEQAKINAETGEAVFIREGISVKELADKLGVKVKDVIGKLMTRGILATINQPLDAEVAVQLCSQFGFSAEVISYEDEVVLTQEEGPEEDKVPRPPVVTVMGHVDHGKSSLLEAIHDVDITSKEFGGITQHIGAYKVKRGEKEYVFLDTPGHEAFTLMRARGAQVTDIVILVVAADDGVMPQTVEAINHCRAANVPIVVAINKMDKPGANPDRVKQDLMAHGVVAEEFGGEAITCAVSAKARQGIDGLLEMVSIVSDMLQLRASPSQPGAGTILESRLDRARGPVASVLIQDGTLKVGDLFLCGSTYGHVRGLFDDRGQRLETVGPATPVEVLGFAEVPAVGALFQVMEDEAKARQVASFRKEQEKARSLRTTKIRLENVFGAIQQGELKELALIVKADVQGSLEALNGQIQNLPQDQVRTRIVHQGVGAISESDILLASASNALVIGFNVRADKKALEISKSESVEVLTFTVIYDLVEQLRSALSGMLKPIEREVILGHAEVREIFRIGKVGTIAGSLIVDGRVLRSARARILRDNVVVFTGRFASLRHYKDDVSEVKEGSECGIGVENFADIKPGDVIEAFEIQMEERKL